MSESGESYLTSQQCTSCKLQCRSSVPSEKLEIKSASTRHWYEAQGHEAEAKLKPLVNHEAEAKALTFWKHKAEAKAEALTFLKHEAEAKAQMLSS